MQVMNSFAWGKTMQGGGRTPGSPPELSYESGLASFPQQRFYHWLFPGMSLQTNNALQSALRTLEAPIGITPLSKSSSTSVLAA